MEKFNYKSSRKGGWKRSDERIKVGGKPFVRIPQPINLDCSDMSESFASTLFRSVDADNTQSEARRTKTSHGD